MLRPHAATNQPWSPHGGGSSRSSPSQGARSSSRGERQVAQRRLSWTVFFPSRVLGKIHGFGLLVLEIVCFPWGRRTLAWGRAMGRAPNFAHSHGKEGRCVRCPAMLWGSHLLRGDDLLDVRGYAGTNLLGRTLLIRPPVCFQGSLAGALALLPKQAVRSSSPPAQVYVRIMQGISRRDPRRAFQLPPYSTVRLLATQIKIDAPSRS